MCMMHITHIFAIPFSSLLALTAARGGTCLLMWAEPCTWEISPFCLMPILYVSFEEYVFEIDFFLRIDKMVSFLIPTFFDIYFTPQGSL